MNNRHFLFLQGPTSPFFSKLGDRLLSEGAGVSKINFNMGDRVYWRNKPADAFRQHVEQLPAFLEKTIEQKGITDIIMLGDTRPVNAAALRFQTSHNVRCQVFEEGYFRPRWLTLEEGGINGFSKLPKCPEWYKSVADTLDPLTENDTIANPILLLGYHEIGYHAPNLLNPLFYPGYSTHRPYISGVELAGWGARFSKMPFYERKDKVTIDELLASKQPYYILPLQLDSDSQIQTHSPFNSMAEVIQTTMASFAAHAPKDTLLVIKNHPLDTGFVSFKKIIQKLERSLGLVGRTLYLESGHLPTLLDHTQGVITINSTVGTSALFHKCRLITLSDPIYNLHGLTAQCSLDEFWTDTAKPDMALFKAFQRTVIHTTQIYGGFYSKKGINAGVDSATERFYLPESPLEQLLKVFPPKTPRDSAPTPASESEAQAPTHPKVRSPLAV